MLRSSSVGSVVTAAMLLLMGGFATVSAQESPPSPDDPSSAQDCLGVTCVEPSSENDVPEARGPVSSVSGPSALERQKSAGFYEYGRGTSLGKRAVAYVAPYGQFDMMPASVRDLPVVAANAAESNKSFREGTVVIFGPEAALFISHGAVAATRAARARQRRFNARAAADAYNCNDTYFCIYDYNNWDLSEGLKMVQFGPFYTGTGFHRLGDFSFNDRAQSMRNRRDRDSLLSQHWNGSTGTGTRYCADSHSVDSTFSNNAIGNNEASAFANVPDDIHC